MYTPKKGGELWCNAIGELHAFDGRNPGTHGESPCDRVQRSKSKFESQDTYQFTHDVVIADSQSLASIGPGERKRARFRRPTNTHVIVPEFRNRMSTLSTS